MNYEAMGSATGAAFGIFKSGVNLITSIPSALQRRQLSEQARTEDTIARRSLITDAGHILSYDQDISAAQRDVDIEKAKKRNVLVATVFSVAALGAVGYAIFSK